MQSSRPNMLQLLINSAKRPYSTKQDSPLLATFKRSLIGRILPSLSLMEPERKVGADCLAPPEMNLDVSRHRRTRGVSRQLVVYSKSPKRPRKTE
jgi:hypothetical protein